MTESSRPNPVPDGGALPSHKRPYDDTPVHTEDLPPLPIRDRNIPAEAWIEAPDELLRSGDDIGNPRIAYKRRIGSWLLWRAGPARKANARYVAIHSGDLRRIVTFRLFEDGTGAGDGPNGMHHERFRNWKHDLLQSD
ncbi:MAG: hypothetical protein ACPGNP_13965 [Acidimicrobiales bacterium]